MIADWLTGNGLYATLWLCMHGDTPWIYAKIASGVYIVASYSLVTIYFFQRYRKTRKTQVAKAMLLGSIVFFLCGATHLIGGAIETFWPAYRLEVLVRFFTGTVNLAYVYYLYRIKFLDRVLNLDAIRRID